MKSKEYKEDVIMKFVNTIFDCTIRALKDWRRKKGWEVKAWVRMGKTWVKKKKKEKLEAEKLRIELEREKLEKNGWKVKNET